MSKEANEIRFRGRRYAVIDRMRVAGRTYLILARLGRAGRQRYQALDVRAGLGGDMRTIHVLPKSR